MKSSKSKGILCIILSALSFSFMSLFIKLSGNVPTLQKSLFRNLVAAFVALILLLKDKPAIGCTKKSFGYVFGRALFGTVGIFCNFYAIDHLNIADAAMLNKLSPFFAVLFSYLILKESVAFYQIVCVITALMGALFILKPDGSSLLSFIILFFSVFSCLCSLPYCTLHYTPMTFIQLFYLILTGVAASFGQFFITAAYSYAPARELSVYDYTNVIFSGIIGFLLLGEIPDYLSYIGCIIIIGASVIMYILNLRTDQKSQQ